MHGVVHANGFGHLLRVNGREGQGRRITGGELVGLWERICYTLRVRCEPSQLLPLPPRRSRRHRGRERVGERGALTRRRDQNPQLTF
jgi:hypothetical protein